MNTLIITLVFGSLTITFMTGIAIMIRNAAKIRSFNKAFKSRSHEETPLRIVYTRSGSKSDIIPLQPSGSLPRLPAHTEEMKLLAY